ncbi:mechanosensitive ion channel family protein [Salidesulfovibrio onnuriiensis]|uniref:mechanosensitive ion channel family protein n=1 Tax=Salidesulfovibrio onnuriiensis TaxID=2583823 RepID=UPI0011CBD482|nr:mechanosensitive ion channel domain-containing protein [Salidesulfovibrio onnuriiensis]
MADNQALLKYLEQALVWVQANVLTLGTTVQLGVVLIAFGLGFLLWRAVRPAMLRVTEDVRMRSPLLHGVLQTLTRVTAPALNALLAHVGGLVLSGLDQPAALLGIITQLLTAWIIIRLLSGLMPNRFWSRIFSVVIWAGAALHIVGLLEMLTDSLNAVGLTVGDSRITLLMVLKGVLMAVVLLQAAAICTRFFEQRMRRTQQFSPSLQVLFIKAVRFSLFASAFLIAISSMGINLTSLAVLSGAVGVGIGFGLQKIFSNLVSGVILLMDRSIKPGDTIEIGGVYGTIRSLHARYASVLTRDGKEYLIPNEQLITNEVVNWTFSDSNVRLKIPVGVAYESDVRKAMRLMEECAAKVGRVLKEPKPAARLVGFGDSSVDLEIRIWIRDSDQGVVNVRSEVLLNIWDAFHEHGVSFPFPQQDVYIKPGSSLKIDSGKE